MKNPRTLYTATLASIILLVIVVANMGAAPARPHATERNPRGVATVSRTPLEGVRYYWTPRYASDFVDTQSESRRIFRTTCAPSPSVLAARVVDMAATGELACEVVIRLDDTGRAMWYMHDGGTTRRVRPDWAADYNVR